MPEVKVSFHTQTARGTAHHNDRSLYQKEGRGDKGDNFHWDLYKCGSSVDAERRFYEENFADVLFEQNERYLSRRHPEKVKDMDAYMKAHPVRESIVQLGDKDTQFGPEYLRRVAPKLSKMFLSKGCRLVSADIHCDRWEDEDGVHEATPHLHMRWMGIDSKGKPNLAGALAEHGVQRPKPDKPRSRHNTELMTFTSDIREFLESEAREYLAEVAPDVTLNTERNKDAKHLEPNDFRLKKRREEKELETERRALQQDVDEDLALSRARLRDEREEYMSEAVEQTVADMTAEAVDVAYAEIQSYYEESIRWREEARESLDEARKTRREATEKLDDARQAERKANRRLKGLDSEIAEKRKAAEAEAKKIKQDAHDEAANVTASADAKWDMAMDTLRKANQWSARLIEEGSTDARRGMNERMDKGRTLRLFADFAKKFYEGDEGMLRSIERIVTEAVPAFLRSLREQAKQMREERRQNIASPFGKDETVERLTEKYKNTTAVPQASQQKEHLPSRPQRFQQETDEGPEFG